LLRAGGKKLGDGDLPVTDKLTSDENVVAQNTIGSSPFVAAMPPGFLMWASMYTVMFYVCGGMIAALYDPN
jgi:hypothetical protein